MVTALGCLICLFWLNSFLIFSNFFNSTPLVVFLIQIEISIFINVLILGTLAWLFDDFSPLLFSLFLLPIAGCEAAIGLILLIRYAVNSSTILIG